MTVCIKQQPNAETCLNEMDSCVGFASALRLIHERKQQAPDAAPPSVDYVIDKLLVELDIRLKDLRSSLHELYVRRDPLTILPE